MLLKGTSFLRREFDAPRPSVQALTDWVESGAIAGKILPDGPYVDMARWTGKRVHAVQTSTTVDLMD